MMRTQREGYQRHTYCEAFERKWARVKRENKAREEEARKNAHTQSATKVNEKQNYFAELFSLLFLKLISRLWPKRHFTSATAYAIRDNYKCSF